MSCSNAPPFRCDWWQVAALDSSAMDWASRLVELGVSLPTLPTPSGLYVPAVEEGGVLYVSGQTWKRDGAQALVGRVGEDVSIERAAESARFAALACLAEASALLGGLERIRKVVRVAGYVRSASGFGRQPAVIDGASQLMLDVFGDLGRHARTSIGVAELPGGAAVEIDAVFGLAD